MVFELSLERAEKENPILRRHKGNETRHVKVWCVLGAKYCLLQFSDYSWLVVGKCHVLSLDFIPQEVGCQYRYQNLAK